MEAQEYPDRARSGRTGTQWSKRQAAAQPQHHKAANPCPAVRNAKTSGESALKAPNLPRPRESRSDQSGTPRAEPGGGLQDAPVKRLRREQLGHINPITVTHREERKFVMPILQQKQPQHAEIALRAYHLWKTEGHPTGSDQRHWLLAEAELKNENGTQVPTPAARTPKRPATLLA